MADTEGGEETHSLTIKHAQIHKIKKIQTSYGSASEFSAQIKAITTPAQTFWSLGSSEVCTTVKDVGIFLSGTGEPLKQGGGWSRV